MQPGGHAPNFSTSSHFVLQEALSQIKHCRSLKNKHLPPPKFYSRPKLWAGYATESGIFKIRFSANNGQRNGCKTCGMQAYRISTNRLRLTAC